MAIKELFDLKEKVIILTGAAGLLGREYANILSEAGADVILVDIIPPVDILTENYGTNPLPCQIDISDKKQVKEMCEEVIKRYGKIDVLINNAVGYVDRGKKFFNKFEDYDIESWNKVLEINLTGTFLISQEVGKQMVKQGYGNIINVSSTYGLVGADQRIYGDSGINAPISYAVTKGGIINMTRFLAAYYEGKNIRVNTLSPGGVFNNQNQEFVKNYEYKTILGRMADKKDYCGAMLFLCSNASSYMTGANLIIDGGWTAW